MGVISIQSEIAKLGLDLSGVMDLVAERTLALIDADGAAIELAEDGDMVYRAASGIAAGQIGLRLKAESSLSGLCVRTGETLRCDDCESDPRVDREACRRVGLRSMITMPLKHNGYTVGAFKAMSKQPAKFSDSDMRVLGLLSDAVGSAMYFAAKYDLKELFHRATHDGLTGLANRSLFMDRLRTMVSQSTREQRAAAVLMIDMDGLKQVNDTFGHRAGDAVIAEFASRIRTVARVSDTVARLGGDEFGIILVPVNLPEGIAATMQRLTCEMAPPFLFEENTYQLRASIGAAGFPDDCADANELIELADQRMYAEKKERRARRAD
jgi:diguanylate cyclase (GGDEF)-like protein